MVNQAWETYLIQKSDNTLKKHWNVLKLAYYLCEQIPPEIWENEKTDLISWKIFFHNITKTFRDIKKTFHDIIKSRINAKTACHMCTCVFSACMRVIMWLLAMCTLIYWLHGRRKNVGWRFWSSSGVFMEDIKPMPPTSRYPVVWRPSNFF